MPVDINRLTEGWLELESDPGLFTLLLENFGVKGVQVEEIYDLQKSLEGPVYGFIFLFRWIEERRSRRKIVHQSETFVKDEEVINNIFFAQQMVPNSCATHALLSVLLNCPSLHLGATLSRLKVHTSGMAPENKGWAIGNTPELAKAHNSHAMPQAKWRLDKSTGITTGRCTAEAFHFVSFVPIQGRLFELDGLKPFPIDHGPWGENEEWTEKFRRVITERLGIASGEQYHDIRFNLMAVVPDKRLALTHKLKMLKTNRQIVLEALQQLVKLSESKCDTNAVFEGKKEEDNGINTGISESKVKQHNMDPPSFELTDLLHAEANCTTPQTNRSNSIKDSSGYSNSTDTALEAHNYVSKIHLVTKSGDTQKTSTNATANTEASSGVKVENLLPPDYSTPLMIHTSPAPSGSSTDTSSEVGSAFNSPTQGWGWNSGQSSPASTKDFKKFVAIRIAASDEEKVELLPSAGRPGKRVIESCASGLKRVCLDAGHENTTQIPLWDHDKEPVSRESKESIGSSDNTRINLFEGRDKFCSKYPELLEPHTFAPKDLLALLKNLESEIAVCEINLHDENEKRKKYKIDDCRRTHNYDEFICTFLSMLAQQGKLADLVEQHLLLQRKPGIPVARVATKKQEIKTNPSRRRRSRAKNRKRK